MVCAGCSRELRGRQRQWCTRACYAFSRRPTRYCKACNEPLTQADKGQYYCGPCRTPKIKVCTNCGQDFVAKRFPKGGISNTRATCSKTCELVSKGKLMDGYAYNGQCRTCHKPIGDWKIAGHYCSAACRASSKTPIRTFPCVDCGADSVGRHGGRCRPCSLERRRARWRQQNHRRREHYRKSSGSKQSPSEIYTIQWLGERDGWRCHLCRRKVNPKLKAPDERSASFDHLIPLSEGGNNSPSNLRLAHLGCNCERGTGGQVQLLLFG